MLLRCARLIGNPLPKHSFAAAAGTVKGLDFGGTPLLLYLQPGSGLVLRNLNVSGTAHIGMFGVFANDQGEERYPPAVEALPTHVDSSPLFPTINNGPNTRVSCAWVPELEQLHAGITVRWAFVPAACKRCKGVAAVRFAHRAKPLLLCPLCPLCRWR